MSGLHFSCGDWMGEDKSADPLFDIIPRKLKEFVKEDEQEAWKSFLAASRRQARSEQLELSPAMMRAIVKPLRRYRDALARKLGLSRPTASIEELGPFPRVVSKDERKLECVRDVLEGNKVCQRTEEPIVVCFV